MSSYTRRALFVVPSSNSLPTTGGPQALTAGQLGVYNQSYVAVTAGTIAASDYILIAQGRPIDLPGVGTKKSAFIYADEVLEWYKIEAHTTASVMIWDVTAMSAKCGEDVTISLRVKSKQTDIGYFNGITKSYTLTTPCCECGEDPCTETDVEALIDDFVTAINADTLVNQFVVAQKMVDGDTFKLRIFGKQVAAENQYADPSVNQHWFDRVIFWVYAYHGPETTQNFLVWDACDAFATTTKVQDATYLTGTSDEVKLIETWYDGILEPPIGQNRYRHDIYNSAFESLVEDGVFYDLYYLKFNIKTNRNWNPTVPQDGMVILAVPNGENATLETLLETYLGAATDESGSNFTTTTTTTSTSTTTTTTTTSTTTTTTTTL